MSQRLPNPVPFVGHGSRRGFLALGISAGAAAALAGCSTGGATTSARIPPNSPKIAAAERARRGPNASTVAVTLDAKPVEVDLGGPTVKTWAFGGEVPGKEIRVKRGQVLQTHLITRLPQPTTVHWHGIALRNDMDGVPNLTQAPVVAGADFAYEFTVPDAGTYWLHPHVGVQLDRGLYAPLIIEDPADGGDYDIVLDDWLDGLGRTPDTVLAALKRNGMTMGGSSGSSMSNMPGISGESSGMSGRDTMPKPDLLGGDAGDVNYPYALANGRVARAPRSVSAKPGQRIRLRLINAASDTAFRLTVPGVRMQITHTDGYPVTPRRAEAALLGMGERLDAVITVPDDGVPILVLAEGRDDYAQVLIKIRATKPPAVTKSAIRQAKSRPVLMPADLVAGPARHPCRGKPDITHDLVIAGPGKKYNWTINGKAHNPKDGMPVRERQRVRLRFVNTRPCTTRCTCTATRSKSGDPMPPVLARTLWSSCPVGPWKSTSTSTTRGQWLTHCHNADQGEAGRMTVVSYVD